MDLRARRAGIFCGPAWRGRGDRAADQGGDDGLGVGRRGNRLEVQQHHIDFPRRGPLGSVLGGPEFDPKRKVIATDIMSRIDVLRSLQIAP